MTTKEQSGGTTSMELTEVKERPILFSTPMVIAVLDDRKDITRRLTGLEEINSSPDDWELMRIEIMTETGKCDFSTYALFRNRLDESTVWVRCKYGKPDDILWVRETWRKYHPVSPDGYTDHTTEIIEYAADEPEMVAMMDGDGCHMVDSKGNERYIPWKPSIHMKREHCRLRLQIKSITVERLHDITEEDAKREGAQEMPFKNVMSYRWGFENLWCQINGNESWASNPWVWRIEFEKL